MHRPPRAGNNWRLTVLVAALAIGRIVAFRPRLVGGTPTASA